MIRSRRRARHAPACTPLLAPLLLLSLLAVGCALEPDRAGDGPLYFGCSDDGACAGGFRCAPNVALLEGELTGLCLPSAALGETTLDPASGCGAFLEGRATGLAASEPGRACLFPFQCPSDGGGGAVLPGDPTGCPLGFVCIASSDGDACAACGFASCDMAAYDAASATLRGLDPGSGVGCLERGVAASSPFADVEAGRVYCRLEPSADGRFAQCPAGWEVAALPEKCDAAAGTFCAIVTGVGGEWPSADTALRAGTVMRAGEPVAPLMLTPAGSLLSCRPSP